MPEASFTGAEMGGGGTTSVPEAAAFDGTYVWMATQFNNTVTRVRASDGRDQRERIIVGKATGGVDLCRWICLVANLLSNNVMKITPSTGAIAGTYAVGDGPGGLAFDGANIWVANRNG